MLSGMAAGGKPGGDGKEGGPGRTAALSSHIAADDSAGGSPVRSFERFGLTFPAMECPACHHHLSKVQVSDLEVEACKGGCGGVFFDNFELQKVDEAHEHLGVQLLEIDKDPQHPPEPGRRDCPKCSMVMMQHFHSVKRQVEVDRCPACNGVWLDLGELQGIRSAFETEEERRQAAQKHFRELFSEDLARMRKDSQEQLERARGVARLFRFILPSYYIPGDQDWGAY